MNLSAPHKDHPSVSDEAESAPTNDERRSFGEKVAGWLRPFFRLRSDGSLKEALEEVIEEHEEQTEEPLPPEERRMLHNVLSFGDITVKEIMTPRTDIEAVPYDIGLADLKSHILRYRHTRIPVYKETLDQMQGFIHVKDLIPMLSGDIGFELHAFQRNLLFVTPSMRIIDLLVRMRKSGIHIAIVLDEYGGTDGLVTLEDLFEEIVGDIHDEHDMGDDDDTMIHQLSEKIYEVSGRIPIESLEQQLGLNLVTEEKNDEFDTLGGFISFQLGRMPGKGEIVPHASGIRFEISEADPRRIRKVRISLA